MLSVAFPHLASVVVEQVLVDDGGVALTARTVTREAACPGCGALSGRVHGGYRRRLADLAVAGRKVLIDLAVRRFLCQAAACTRRTFVEQIDGLTERFARRTPALRRVLERIALALAGRPAARLAAHLSVPVSANSLIRMVRRFPDPQPSTAPRVMGIDDFAFKKGHVYGTIILNVETGERVDVLPDRTSRTVRRHLEQLRASGKPAPERPKELTVRKATWLITAHPDKIDESNALKRKQLLARCPELDAVADCVRNFAWIMTERRGSELDDWLTAAENTGLKPLRSLARGLRQDFDAVTAGLTLEWSSSKVEGNVNRVKRIKRDGYGRAGFDLLPVD